eukprot:gnl/MRDRNA2_/MRDRNA2_237955_c0_seq1.p1 gnl/MRDRNA2_/MRDRNA2_237955_c0~~gnl/MRDRNA2_/MRDRNA2_237955_c0_seq1.p1  ORF type:complete len:258 (+),score=41.43 gnl/MRDRNA2_/MRDRNA2_237955_c0_seq1:74-847(+)
MITFLPYPDFQPSLNCLDLNRLRAQRREARDILRLVLRRLEHFDDYHRQTDILHPAVVMWQSFPAALYRYYRLCLEEYTCRGYDNGSFSTDEFVGVCETEDCEMPPWLGDEALHQSHRVKLFTKLPEHYRSFGWEPEVTQVLGTKGLDEFQVRYVWPGGEGVWAAYRAERQRLARENPAPPEVKARVRAAYQSWARCKICRSPAHREHNCSAKLQSESQSSQETAVATISEKQQRRSPRRVFDRLNVKCAKVVIDLA